MADTAVAPAQRTLPHNLEAERSVLGAILIHNDAFNMAAQVIDSADFYRDDHRRIFNCMVSLSERNAAIDFVTLKDELARGGELDAVGGPAYVAGLADGVPRATNVDVLRADRQGEVHTPEPDLRGQQDPDQRVRSRPGRRRDPGRGRRFDLRRGRRPAESRLHRHARPGEGKLPEDRAALRAEAPDHRRGDGLCGHRRDDARLAAIGPDHRCGPAARSSAGSLPPSRAR